MQWSRSPPARVHVVAAPGVQGFEQQQLLALVTASELETGIPCGQRQEEEVKTTQVSFLEVYVKMRVEVHSEVGSLCRECKAI